MGFGTVKLGWREVRPSAYTGCQTPLWENDALYFYFLIILSKQQKNFNRNEFYFRKLIDNFRMTIVVSKKILGKGSFATVFEGTQGETRIAVKRIEIERCDATEIRREEENLKKLNHPNVIRLLDAWSDDLFK